MVVLSMLPPKRWAICLGGVFLFMLFLQFLLVSEPLAPFLVRFPNATRFLAFVLFAAVFLFVWSFLCLFPLFVSRNNFPSIWRRLFALLISLHSFFSLSAVFKKLVLPHHYHSHSVFWTLCSVCLVSNCFILFAAVLVEGSAFLLSLLCRWWCHSKRDTHNSYIIESSKRLRTGLILFLVSVLLVHALHEATRLPPKVVIVEVDIPGLPWQADGFTILQLSDVHLLAAPSGSGLWSYDHKKAFVEWILRFVDSEQWQDMLLFATEDNPAIEDNAAAETKQRKKEVGLVALTGDLVDGSVEEVGSLVAELVQQIPNQHGVFFVPGNHEYHQPPGGHFQRDWMPFFRSVGIRSLLNDAVIISTTGNDDCEGGGQEEKEEQLFVLAGVDDYAAVKSGGEGPNLTMALNAVGASGSHLPIVLLAHRPQMVYEAAEKGAALQLSGHTHGGQIFPMHFLLWLVDPHLAGLYREPHPRDRSASNDPYDLPAIRSSTTLYVSSGATYGDPPLRFLASSEIALFILRSPHGNP
ncbi:TMPPE metallophosphoesterase [Balamuthia mandrillaris]